MADEPIRKYALCFLAVLFFLLLFLLNFAVQLIRKPAEVVGLFAKGSYKTSYQTWEAYEVLFKKHSTHIMTPQYLCAMAQVESGGNPLITPKWKWRWTSNIMQLYAPASSSVGLLQYTDATFKEAKQFCIHDHKVALAGPLSDFDSCWFNFLYTRLSPSDSIEMTSARLHYHIEQIMNQYGYTELSIKEQQKLGAVIHLCGLNNAKKFAERNFNFNAIPKCGDHDPAVYYGRIEIIMNSLLRMKAN